MKKLHTFGIGNPHAIVTQVELTYVTMVRKFIRGRMKTTFTTITAPSAGESLINQFRIRFIKFMQM